jgi:hypothetical protein
MPDPTLKNVFEAILKYGHDEDFAPKSNEDFRPPKRRPARAKSWKFWPSASAAAIRCGTTTTGRITAV